MAGLCCLLSLFFGCIICEANWVVVSSCLKMSTRWVGSWALEKGSSASQDHLLPVPSTGSPDRNYRVICHWQLPVLGLEVPVRVCAVN